MIFTAWCVVKRLKCSPWPRSYSRTCGMTSDRYSQMTFTDIQLVEEFVRNPYLWLRLGILYRLPSIAVSSQYGDVNTYPNNRRVWMR
jgi:hypothetical protein